MRDEIKYNPYSLPCLLEHYRASTILEKGKGYCVQKAVLLAALARATGVPARLRFADIRNHIVPKKLAEMLGTNLFIYHGYDELYLDGNWIKATPVFNLKICQKSQILPVEFDGKNHAIFHSHNQDGKPHFEFHLFRSMSNIKVREALSAADIAVDQLFSTAGGMFAIESMAAGCAVLGGNIPEFAGYPRELPILHTDPDNIYQNLRMLLENPELRHDIGAKGRKYVEKYHDSRKIADDILRLLAGNTEGLTWYDPKAL